MSMSEISRFTRRTVTLAQNAVGERDESAVPKWWRRIRRPRHRFAPLSPSVPRKILPRRTRSAARDATNTPGDRPR